MAEKRGITVKVEDELHRQVKEYIESHGMTMSDFVSQALEEMLHPKQQMGGNTMGAMRTIASQGFLSQLQGFFRSGDRHHRDHAH